MDLYNWWRSKGREALCKAFPVSIGHWGPSLNGNAHRGENSHRPDGAPAFLIPSLYATFSEKPSRLSGRVSAPMLLCFYFYCTYIKLFTNTCLFSQNIPSYEELFLCLLLRFSKIVPSHSTMASSEC